MKNDECENCPHRNKAHLIEGFGIGVVVLLAVFGITFMIAKL